MNDKIQTAFEHFKVRQYSHQQLMENSASLRGKQFKDDSDRGKHIIEARLLLFHAGLISTRELIAKISSDVEFFFIEPWLCDRKDPTVNALLSRASQEDCDKELEEAISKKKAEIINALDLGFLSVEISKADSEKMTLRKINNPSLEDAINFYEIELGKADEHGMQFSGAIIIGAIIESKLQKACWNKLESIKSHFRAAKSAKYKIKNVNNPSSWTLESMIDLLSDIGVIRNETTDFGILNCKKLAHLIRSSRNLIHPNKALASFRDVELIDQRYWDSQAALTILSHQISD